MNVFSRDTGSGEGHDTNSYVSIGTVVDPAEAESISLRIENGENDEVIFIQTDRNFVLCIHAFYAIFLTLFGTCLGFLLYFYHGSWHKRCDLLLKVWSVVWLVRVLLQLVHNFVMTTIRIRRQRPSEYFLYSTRFIHTFGFTWWLYGIDVLFFEPHCDDETLAQKISEIMFWLMGSIYLIPFLIYTLLCLCLPCMIYFMVHFAVHPADRQPTPPEIINQLEIKTYRALIDALRRQYVLENDSRSERTNLIPGFSFENVLGSVSSLLSSHNGRLQGSNSSAQISPREERSTITINKSCPICMVDLIDDDEILVMPCDNRHFFHKACVEHWLETSQACPICRANIVHIITGTPVNGRDAPVGQNDIEMQL